MTPILRSLLFNAARRAAFDPRLRAQVIRQAQRVKPAAERAAAGARAAVQEAARQAPPRENPRGFAEALLKGLRRRP